MAHDTAHHSEPHGDVLPYAGHGDSHEHHGTGIYWFVFIALMVLLVATVLVAFINMGRFNVPVAYAIATLKAVLILWFFMHLNQSTRLTQVFAFASFAWLLIFLIMMAGDYMSRHILPRADGMTMIRRVDSYEQQSGYRSNLLPGQPGYRETHAATHPAATHPATGQPAATQPAD